MLKNAPLIGEHPIVQPFGDNPDAYAHIRCGDVALRGHNGLDFGAPAGAPVLAVQDGVVLSVGEEPDGLGKFVLLGHEWGQSLYAHLDQVEVGQGQQVQAGDQLGLSGNTGVSAAPHLHFGMRIHPFSVADGWCGYSDPEPYLERLTVPRGAIIGPHIIGGIPQHLETLARWQPRMVLVLDPNPDEIRRLRQTCPATAIVGRVFATDQEVDQRIRDNPQEAAQWAHEKCMERMTRDVGYWQVANEVLVTEDGLSLLNEFELERMRLAEANGYKCALFGFSVGNPDLPEDDRMARWRQVYPAIEQAEAGGHIIALHQYGMPDLWGPDDLYDWLIYRLEHQVLRRLPYKKVQFAVTEYGIDGRIQGVNAGWQEYTDADGYTNQLLKSGAYAERFSGRILGYAVFTLGQFAPWETYDIAGDVANMLADRSQRGVWDDVDTHAGGFAPDDGDHTISPGGDDAITEPGGETTEPGGETAKPGDGGDETEGSGDTMNIERRISDWVAYYNMKIHPLEERPDNPDPDGDTVYVLKDVFTTYLGSWEESDQPGAAPQWARDDYLKPEFLEAGADHHLLAAVLDADGNLIKKQKIRFWSDGFDKLGDPNYDGYSVEETNEDSGWVNHALYPGSSFVPERGESGPWCWVPEGAADVICGGGLPARHHLSTFAVWQAVPRAEYEGAVTEPGGEIGEPVTEPGGEIGEPVTEPGGEIGEPVSEVVVERRISDQATAMNMGFHTIEERPDNPDPDGSVKYVVKDVFTTRNGSWDPSDEFGAIPQWARDDYLKPWGAPDYFDDAGADHHLFAAVLGQDGELIRQQPIIFWSDGFDKLGDPDYDGYVHRETKEGSGWINIPLGPGSNFVPERGESGPWCWAPEGAAEVFCGGGMPAKQHISTFVVWQEVPRNSTITEPDTGGEVTEPGGGEETGNVERRLSDWVEPLNIDIKALEERPDNPDPDGEIVYLVKDIFTTYNGSWEPGDGFASVPQWARDDYLKPWGAPDYFDDAGADHHLFAAIIGLDGELMREQDIQYWSDGFDKLGDPDYDGYIHRNTKRQSGWANIPMGPSSSYVPERGESGPWCWAPSGAAEVVCGGGMPAKQHVSTFVVWQAVRRQDLEGGESETGGESGESGDHNIFIPIVMGGNAPEAQDAPQRTGESMDEVQASPAATFTPPPELGESVHININRIRNVMWTRLGLKPRADSPIARYARNQQLGMPVTQQFDVDAYRVQGFEGGIVYMKRRNERDIGTTPW